MTRINTISLYLLAALLLSSCQLFEPLPTLPPVLTLEPLGTEVEAASVYTQIANALATTSTAPPAEALPATQVTETNATLPATSEAFATTTATQAQAAASSATSQPTQPNQPTAPAPAATRPAATPAYTETWHDVPIMPGANESGEEDGAYSYSVSASVAQVQTFYDQQMPLSGWAPFASGEGEAGNLLLMFQKGDATATIGIISQGGGSLVRIVAE